MNRNVWTIALVATIFAVIVLWSTPGFPAKRGNEQIPSSELRRIVDLSDSLQRDLRVQAQQLRTACDDPAVHDRLDEAQRAAFDAVARLGTLWRAGRLRAGGFALSEVLFYDFAAVIDEAARDMALVERLARLREETLHGSSGARALLQEIVEEAPAAPACLVQALDESSHDDSSTAHLLESIFTTIYDGNAPAR